MGFTEIAILLVFAAIAASVAKIFKQPLLIGYLFAGFALSFLGIVHDVEVFSGLGQIGVTLLLFLLGIEMNLSELPTIGKVAAIAGFAQIASTVGIGFLLSLFLGLGVVPALFVAIALTFSSTIVIVKILSEKRDLGSLYGKISVGLLLVQDLFAVIVLMFLSGLENNTTIATYGLIFVKGFVLILVTAFLSKKVLPAFFDKLLASSSELLFISSIAWALGVAALVAGPLGFTLEIGGFLAGLALSGLTENLQIASRTRPLRDFFLAIFFIGLGTQIVIADLGAILVPTIVLSLFVIIVDPLIVLVIMSLMGYTKRTSLFVGLTMTQISEFSLILMVLAREMGYVSDAIVSLVILVGVVTMTASTYIILQSDRIYKYVKKYIAVFERSRPQEMAINVQKAMSNHVILIGADRTGLSIIKFLTKHKVPFVVIDFNPKVFTKLTAENIPVVMGDSTDEDILELVSLGHARLVISTTGDIVDNLTLLSIVKKMHVRPMTIFTSMSREDGLMLYEKGADYVLVPHTVTGEHIRHILATYGVGSERIKKIGKASFNRLIAT